MISTWSAKEWIATRYSTPIKRKIIVMHVMSFIVVLLVAGSPFILVDAAESRKRLILLRSAFILALVVVKMFRKGMDVIISLADVVPTFAGVV